MAKVKFICMEQSIHLWSWWEARDARRLFKGHWKIHLCGKKYTWISEPICYVDYRGYKVYLTNWSYVPGLRALLIEIFPRISLFLLSGWRILLNASPFYAIIFFIIQWNYCYYSWKHEYLLTIPFKLLHAFSSFEVQRTLRLRKTSPYLDVTWQDFRNLFLLGQEFWILSPRIESRLLRERN